MNLLPPMIMHTLAHGDVCVSAQMGRGSLILPKKKTTYKRWLSVHANPVLVVDPPLVDHEAHDSRQHSRHHR